MQGFLCFFFFKKTVGTKAFVNPVVRWYFEPISLLDFLIRICCVGDMDMM